MTDHGVGRVLDSHIHERRGPLVCETIIEISSSASYNKRADGGDIGLHYLNN